MNDLVLLCLVMFIFIRAIGLGVSIDFFYDSRDHKFLFFMLCWVFWIIANIFPILADMTDVNSLKEFYLVLNITFALGGFVFYTWGFFTYYMNVPFRLLAVLVMISFLLPLLLYVILGFTFTMLFSVFLVYTLLLMGYIIPPIKRKEFVKYMGKSIRWYYAIVFLFTSYFPISAISFLSGYSYGVYNAEETLLIVLYYVPSISSTVLLIILLVHLEYTISSREKYGLKDKYSHNLGNIIQAIKSSSELIKLSANLTSQEKSNLELINQKCKESVKLIKEIREL